VSLAMQLRNLSRPLVEYRAVLSFGLSATCGIVLQSLYPVRDADPLLRLLALERPAIFHVLVWSYNLFLYSTPFLIFSILFSLAYVHCYTPRRNQASGPLPPYPDPLQRESLEMIVGEQDYIDVSLDGDIRYNPLNNDSDAYAQPLRKRQGCTVPGKQVRYSCDPRICLRWKTGSRIKVLNSISSLATPRGDSPLSTTRSRWCA